jgi:hypothetical protein
MGGIAAGRPQTYLRTGPARCEKARIAAGRWRRRSAWRAGEKVPAGVAPSWNLLDRTLKIAPAGIVRESRPGRPATFAAAEVSAKVAAIATRAISKSETRLRPIALQLLSRRSLALPKRTRFGTATAR